MKLRKMTALLGMALLVSLTGCGGETTVELTTVELTTEVVTTPETTKAEEVKPSSLHIPMSQYPIVDGSTACLPLMAQVMARVTEIPLEDAQSIVKASKTANSWLNLINGDADLLLVYEMPEVIKEDYRYADIEMEIAPIGKDALVFLANEKNPLNSLTKGQLQDIYTGKVKNWKELGGEDIAINAFQRDAASGSQTLFKKLLMKDLELMEAPTEFRPGMMGELVDALANYNNESNAIGYSVYYYISEMYSKPGLKLLGVDGIIPTYETIQNGSYSLTNDFYVVIRKDEPENSPARKLYNWMLTGEGTESLKDAGYVPVQ